jgi:DNA invertase Pin-like site-specific DNA recombinase
MATTWAYLRVSTDSQDLSNQKLLIFDWANRRNIKIDHWLEVAISSRKSQKDRRIEELLSRIQSGDLLIVSELSRLGRSTGEVINLVNELVARNVCLVVVKQGLELRGDNSQDMGTKVMITVFSLLAELERDLISERTKIGLARARAQGKKLGRPRGSTSRSKLDGKEDVIKELLNKKIPKTSIAKILDCSRSCLINFIKSRKLA